MFDHCGIVGVLSAETHFSISALVFDRSHEIKWSVAGRILSVRFMDASRSRTPRGTSVDSRVTCNCNCGVRVFGISILWILFILCSTSYAPMVLPSCSKYLQLCPTKLLERWCFSILEAVSGTKLSDRWASHHVVCFGLLAVFLF